MPHSGPPVLNRGGSTHRCRCLRGNHPRTVIATGHPGGRRSGMKLLFWHMHGGWADAFVRGGHDYLLPTTAPGDPFGLGRAGRDWPETAHEITPGALRNIEVDAVILQRLEEITLAERWLAGRKLGHDVPAVFVEHNTPRGNEIGRAHV